MASAQYREVLYNYTSADDRNVIHLLLGADVWDVLEALRDKRRTGRSARLLMRLVGDLFIHFRNPFLYQELITSRKRQADVFDRAEKELELLLTHADNEREVKPVLNACQAALHRLQKRVNGEPGRRRALIRRLSPCTTAENISFKPFDLVSHSTDATDWRLYPPVAVLRPKTAEEIIGIMLALKGSAYNVIPRGGGTGLTGGSVPLAEDCIIINTEKLNTIFPVEMVQLKLENGVMQDVPILPVQAGAITEDVMNFADGRDLVFSADPTSAWASTIGGNIAENAGGKKAVRWGTTLDSVLSYRMVMPTGELIEIKRRNHPMRKILPEDTVIFDITNGTKVVETIELPGLEIRRKGVWKDITNKVLGGLPGMQKEGTDGIITDAKFVLYPKYNASRTVCLEFFGDTMDEACEVIQKISEALPPGDEEALLAMEHFDDKYMEAIDYKVKGARKGTPKAVLLIDIVGHTDEQADRGVATVKTVLEAHANTDMQTAADDAEATVFWKDRKNLGAIAARTNAFKLNEDIVLPIPALADFVRFLDDLNNKEDRYNLLSYLTQAKLLLKTYADGQGGDDLLARKVLSAEEIIESSELELDALNLDESGTAIIQQTVADLAKHFQGFPDLQKGISELYDEVRKRIIIIATHMHAGDGNVHVNIPVFSNDRDMMMKAEEAVDIIMDKVKALGGVVSGEHGIGITKLKYWDKDRIDALKAYRQEKDPDGIMNVDKLESMEKMELVYTPSFNLLELEARILHYGGLESLAGRIAKCIRCGKCKSNCCVFYPDRNMFYHPRNKNLAIGSLVEALLYDAQCRQEVGFELLKHLEDIGDHCTVCHKCVTPCPVNIDTGDVSIFERELLAKRKFKHTSPATRLSLEYLQSDSPVFNQLFRSTVLVTGSAVQSVLSRMLKPLVKSKAASKLYPAQMLEAPMSKPHAGTLYGDLPKVNKQQALVLQPEGDAQKTIFYFPGCGSERLFSDVSRAAILMLLKTGVRVVLPPPFLCCGFPAHVNAKNEMADKSVLKDLILFSQVREMLSYYEFDACLITCGTCKEALTGMGIQDIFGCGLMDSSRFLQLEGLTLKDSNDCLYHAPCHDSLDGKAQEVLERMAPGTITAVPHCCSEAGTLAMSRPDIASAMRERKRNSLDTMKQETGATKILTNCPSCLQGLGRNADLGITPCHISIALAERYIGTDWKNHFKSVITTAEVINL